MMSDLIIAIQKEDFRLESKKQFYGPWKHLRVVKEHAQLAFNHPSLVDL